MAVRPSQERGASSKAVVPPHARQPWRIRTSCVKPTGQRWLESCPVLWPQLPSYEVCMAGPRTAALGSGGCLSSLSLSHLSAPPLPIHGQQSSPVLRAERSLPAFPQRTGAPSPARPPSFSFSLDSSLSPGIGLRTWTVLNKHPLMELPMGSEAVPPLASLQGKSSHPPSQPLCLPPLLPPRSS